VLPRVSLLTAVQKEFNQSFLIKERVAGIGFGIPNYNIKGMDCQGPNYAKKIHNRIRMKLF